MLGVLGEELVMSLRAELIVLGDSGLQNFLLQTHLSGKVGN